MTEYDCLARLRALRDQWRKQANDLMYAQVVTSPASAGWLNLCADDLDGLLTQLEQEMKETHEDYLSRVAMTGEADPPLTAADPSQVGNSNDPKEVMPNVYDECRTAERALMDANSPGAVVTAGAQHPATENTAPQKLVRGLPSRPAASRDAPVSDRFLLNSYGRQCFDLGYEAATKAQAVAPADAPVPAAPLDTVMIRACLERGDYNNREDWGDDSLESAQGAIRALLAEYERFTAARPSPWPPAWQAMATVKAEKGHRILATNGARVACFEWVEHLGFSDRTGWRDDKGWFADNLIGWLPLPPPPREDKWK